MNKTLRAIIIAGIFTLPFLVLPAFNFSTWNLLGHDWFRFDSFFPFITGKNFSFRIIVEIITAAWLVLAIRDEKYAPRKSWITVGLLAFLGTMLVSTILSENPYKSFWSNYERMEGYVTLLHLGAYFFVLGATFLAEKTERLWNYLLYTMLGANFFVCLFAVLQATGELVINQGGIRVDGTLGNATYLAGYVLVHMFIALFLLVSKHRFQVKNALLVPVIGFASYIAYYVLHISATYQNAGRAGLIILTISILGLLAAGYAWIRQNRAPLPAWVGRVVLGIVMLTQLYVLYRSETRGAALGLIVGLLFMAAYFAFSKKVHENYMLAGRIALGGLVLVLGLLVGFKDTQILRENTFFARVRPLLTLDVHKIVSTEFKSRAAIWSMAAKGGAERPLFGWGQESFNYLFYKHYTPNMYDQEAWFDRAHNVFMDWFTAGGVLGLLAYLSLFAALLYYIWRKPGFLTSFLGREPFTIEERVAMTALLIAYFVHNIFVFDNLISYIFFFTFLAFIHSHYEGGAYTSLAQAIKKHREMLETIAVPAIVVVAIIGLFYVNYTPLMNSLKLSASLSPMSPQAGGIQKNIQMFNELASDSFFGRYEAREQIVLLASRLASIGPDRFDPAIKDQIYSLAYTEMKKQLDETPNDARYYYFMTGLLTVYGRFAEALPIIEKGVTLSPNKQLLISNYATVLFRLGQKEKALEQFKKAFELDTNYTAAGIQYFAAKEDFPKLIEQMEKYVADAPGDTQMLFNLGYYTAKNGDKEKAKVIFQRVLAQDPNLAPQIEQTMKDLRIK